MKTFYSYLWLRGNNTPYYAGKGSGARAFLGGGRHSMNPPRDISRIVIFPMANEMDAFESEKALIELFGRKNNGTGILRNFTDGGEGTSGWRHPPETCRRIGKIVGEANRRRIISEETRQKLRDGSRGNWASRSAQMLEGRHKKGITEFARETSRKNGLANKGKRRSLEVRQKMSEYRLGRHVPAISKSLIGNQRTKGMKIWLGRKHSEESRKKISLSKIGKPSWNKGKKMSPEICRRNSEAQKGHVPWNRGKKGLQVAWNKGKTKCLTQHQAQLPLGFLE